jgi:exosortase
MNIDTGAVSKHIKKHKYPYILIAIIILLNIQVIRELIQDWIRDDNYSHGFLIIPISVYLFYKRSKGFSFPAKPSGWGIALLLAGCFGFILGSAASEYFTTRVSLVMIIAGVSLYYLGTENFRRVWFPFVFLLFMIPIPAVIYYSATLPMQLFGSKVTVNILQLIGVPATRQGNIIYLPNYAMEVAEACSGLRSLVTLMALGSLYGYLTLPGKIAPLIMFAATIPIAITTNIFRIIVTAIGAYGISRELAEDFLHELSGTLVFITALILVIILGTVLKWIIKSSR